MKVRATRVGYQSHRVRQIGEVFEIESESQLGSWMERLDGVTAPSPATASSSAGPKAKFKKAQASIGDEDVI